MTLKNAPRALLLGAFLHSALASAVVSSASKSHFADFLIFDDNAPAIIELAAAQPEAFTNLSESSLNAVFDFLFLKNQRENTRNWVKNLYNGSSCEIARKDAGKQKVCEYLLGLWTGPLAQTFFWDASVVQLSRARELLQTPAKTPKLKREQCQDARSLLVELEAKEGLLAPLLETQSQVFKCLDDEAGRLDVYQKLEALRNIHSAITNALGT